MDITTKFSGTFETIATGQPTKRVSYNGSISKKKGKMSFGIETNIDGVVRKLSKNNITNPQSLAGDPQVRMFLESLKTQPTRRRKR